MAAGIVNMVAIYKRLSLIIFVMCAAGIVLAALTGTHIPTHIAVFSIASSYSDTKIVLMDTRLMRPYALIHGRSVPSNDIFIAWSHDGRSMIYYSDNQRGLYIADPTGRYRRFLAAPCDGPVAWSPDDSRLLCNPAASYGGDREMYAQDVRVMALDGIELLLTPDLTTGSALAAWSPDGTRLAYMETRQSSPQTHTLVVVNADGSGRQDIGVIDIPFSLFTTPTWLNDGTEIAYPGRCEDGTGLVIWHVNAHTQTCLLAEFSAYPLNAFWSPDKTKLALLGSCGLLILDVATGEQVCQPMTARYLSAAWSSDSTRLAFSQNTLMQSGGYETTLVIYNIADRTGQVVYRLENTPVTAFDKIVPSPDDMLMAFTPLRFNGDGMLTQVYDTSTGQVSTLVNLSYVYGGFSAWQPEPLPPCCAG